MKDGRTPFWVADFRRSLTGVRHATELTLDAVWQGKSRRYLTLCGKSITAGQIRNEAFDLLDERSCRECERVYRLFRAHREREA